MRKKIISFLMSLIICFTVLIPSNTHGASIFAGITIGEFALTVLDIALISGTAYKTYKTTCIDTGRAARIEEEAQEWKKNKQLLKYGVSVSERGYSMQKGLNLKACTTAKEVQSVLSLTDAQTQQLQHEYDLYLKKKAARMDYEIRMQDEKNKGWINGAVKGMDVIDKVVISEESTAEGFNLDSINLCMQGFNHSNLKFNFFFMVSSTSGYFLNSDDDIRLTYSAKYSDLVAVDSSNNVLNLDYMYIAKDGKWAYGSSSYSLVDDFSFVKDYTFCTNIPFSIDLKDTMDKYNALKQNTKDTAVAVGYPTYREKADKNGIAEGAKDASSTINTVLDGLIDGTLDRTYPVSRVGEATGEGDVTDEDVGKVVLPSIFKTNVDEIAGEKIKTEKGFDFQPLMAIGKEFTGRFPFSLPWDLIGVVQMFQAERVPPSFMIDLSGIGKSAFKGQYKPSNNYKFEFNFNAFDKCATALRFFILACFIVGLIKVTSLLTKH